jgi:hypothetical protein
MTSRTPSALALLLAAACVHGTPQTPQVNVQPRLFIEGIDVESAAGEEPLPAGNPLLREQGFAIRLRSQGYLQVVEEQTSGAAAFLAQVSSAASHPAGSIRIPETGFLRSSASARSVCLVVSSRPLPQPSCAEEDGRGEDRVPPPPPPKEREGRPPPPPPRDDNRTRSPDLIRLVRRLTIAG